MSTLKNFRNSLLGATCVALLATASHAADAVAPNVAEAPVTDGYQWSGLYAGFGIGAGAGIHEYNIADVFIVDGLGREGVFGEVTVGYDFMLGDRFLLGAFADARFGNITFETGPLEVVSDYGFDVVARAGYLVTPQTLAYVLGGYSWQHFDWNIDGDNVYDWGVGGYVVGLGLETVIHSKWTLKTEYRYSQYADDDLGSDGFVSTEPRYHTFHAGLNYRFNGGPTAAGFETPAYNWTGFYIGGAIGAGAFVEELGDGDSLNGLGGDGVLGEISVGYDHEFGNGWVAGVMADARLSNLKNEITIDPVSFVTESDYGFDVLARVGKKVNDSTLAYVLGGYSWQHVQFGVETPFGDFDIVDGGSNGFSIGGGLETAFSTKTTVNLEYRYSQFEDKELDGLRVEPSLHTVRIGAKYKFN